MSSDDTTPLPLNVADIGSVQVAGEVGDPGAQSQSQPQPETQPPPPPPPPTAEEGGVFSVAPADAIPITETDVNVPTLPPPATENDGQVINDANNNNNSNSTDNNVMASSIDGAVMDQDENKNVNNHHPGAGPGENEHGHGHGHELGNHHQNQHQHHEDVTMHDHHHHQTSIPIPQDQDMVEGDGADTNPNADPNADPDTSSAMVPQDPSFGFSYFAVRRGKAGLRSSVFLNWRDCEKFIAGYERAEYASFDKFEEAVAYLMSGGDQHDSDAEGIVSVNVNRGNSGEHGDDEVIPIGAVPAKKRKLGFTTTTEIGVEKDVNLISPFTNNLANRRGVRVKAEANPNRKPTKAWDKMYQRYVEYINTNGSIEVDTSKENADLLRWTRQQQHEYRYLKEGKASSMFQVKIDKLREIGFEFKFVSMEERLSALLKYKDKYGHFNVPETHPVLGKWVDEQKKAAKKFAEEGDATAFFDGKIKELISLGFTVDVEEVPANEKNTSNQSSSSAIEKSSDMPGKAINPIPIGGFASTSRNDEDKKWTKHFAELEEYRKEHGTCEVPPSQHTPLSYWVTQQHKEYQKVQEGKTSRLTLQKVQQLTDLGFVFRQVAKSFTWEQRIDQLRKYKEKHGHTRVPKSDPTLGVFVNRQRYEYSKYKSNRPSTMNESRLRDLEELDFVFVAGKKMDHVDFKNKKSWEQRYDELLGFRETYGHAVVPQSFPGLGEWVHSQRLYYKKLKAGKKSPLTQDRVLKLADVGFVFDATKRRGNHVNDIPATSKTFGSPGMESSPLASLTPMTSIVTAAAATTTTEPPVAIGTVPPEETPSPALEATGPNPSNDHAAVSTAHSEVDAQKVQEDSGTLAI